MFNPSPGIFQTAFCNLAIEVETKYRFNFNRLHFVSNFSTMCLPAKY
ncbi:hypothetical protein NEIFL0001_0607 [Neisseria flavescens SK114]|nr:hypothetical protein NEIFL0001_0607 [Neisseria flavescens SK114]